MSTSVQARTYTIGSGVPIRLGERFGHGRTGSIYTVAGEPELAAKMYVPDYAPPARLQRHLRTPAEDFFDARGRPRLAWPLAALHAPDGAVAGYVMPKILQSWQPLDMYLSHVDRETLGFVRTWEQLAYIALDLAEWLDRLHARGLLVGDLSSLNVLASSGHEVAFVDCDDMVWHSDARGDEARTLITQNYGAPELQQDPAAPIGVYTDAWSLCVLIVQLLQDGVHPFAGVTSKSEHSPRGIAQNLEDGHTRFRRRAVLGRKNDSAWLPVETLPPAILRLAESCLVDHRVDGRQLRPRPARWAEALREVRFAQCEDRREHVFSQHLLQCPWCAHIRRGGEDPFPPLVQKGPHR